MKNVHISVDVLLSDDVADWVESISDTKSFSSDITYYLDQVHSGGVILTKDRLEEIILDVVGELDDDSEFEENDENDGGEDTDLSDIESIMRRVLSEFISSGSGFVVGQGVSDSDEEDDVVTDSDTIQSFGLQSQSDSSEEISDEDMDDLADMFGF